jgi:phage shock protein C
MKKLYRSKNDKMIAGICGGVGERFSIDPTLIRLAVVFVGVASCILPMLAAYIVAWIIIPVEPQSEEGK